MDVRGIRRGLTACALAVSTGFGTSAHAATLASWSFDAPDGTFTGAADVLAPGASAGAWSDLDGTLSNYGGASGRAVGARSFDDGNSLRVTVDAGAPFTLEELRFEQQASASGPKSWTVRVNGTVAASGATSSTLSPFVVPVGVTAALFELSFDGLDAASAQGTWRLDNVALIGTSPVPLPAALPLFVSGLLGLYTRRR